MPNFKLEFDWDLSEDEQALVNMVMMQIQPQATAAVAAAVAAEREAIIQMMDEWTRDWPMSHARGICRDIAARTRSRASGGGKGER